MGMNSAPKPRPMTAILNFLLISMNMDYARAFTWVVNRKYGSIRRENAMVFARFKGVRSGKAHGCGGSDLRGWARVSP
jgi:hypothetical protein